MCEYVGQACFIEVHGFEPAIKDRIILWWTTSSTFESAIMARVIMYTTCPKFEPAIKDRVIMWWTACSYATILGNLKSAKWNERSQYKSTAAIFSSSLHICPVFFHLVMHRHVLDPCYARFEHDTGIEGYVTYYVVCYVWLWVQNMPACHLRKYGQGKWADWRKKLQ